MDVEKRMSLSLDDIIKKKGKGATKGAPTAAKTKTQGKSKSKASLPTGKVTCRQRSGTNCACYKGLLRPESSGFNKYCSALAAWKGRCKGKGKGQRTSQVATGSLVCSYLERRKESIARRSPLEGRALRRCLE